MPIQVSPATHLIIKGARHHNLKNINLTLPKNKLIVFSGLSGSGKSSLAFDTIYAEGQRRYVESLSSYARQFLGIMPKPDVDSIDGLSPAISIDQKTTSHNPRSTVGTITEIYDYLRLLYARIGHPHCENCGSDISPQSGDQIAAQLSAKIINSVSNVPVRWMILSPVVRDKKGEFSTLFANLQKKGFDLVRVDGRIMHLTDDFLLLKTNRHSISVVMDRITFTPQSKKNSQKIEDLNRRLRQAVEQSLNLSSGLVMVSQILDQSLNFPENPFEFTDALYSQASACPRCNLSFPELEPRLFSFNTPHGACPTCTGLGSLLKIDVGKIIAPEISLSEGAIIPLANALSTDSWYARKLAVICSANHSVTTIPYEKLPDSLKTLILYGSKEWFRVTGSSRDGREASFSFQWEGIVHELERRYQETQSEFMRSELVRFMKKETCPDCLGARLKKASLSVTINNQSIYDLTKISIDKLLSFISNLINSQASNAPSILSETEVIVSSSILKEIKVRTTFLISVGLDYLNLGREAATLAGGESQRIRLASQIGTGLTGILYVLDEPTIGLHPKDNERLIQSLIALRDLGNTVLIVEHDQEVISSADYLVDFGPGAGSHGGEVVGAGDLISLMENPASLTGAYLNGSKKVDKISLISQAKKLHPSLSQSSNVQDSLIDHNLTIFGAKSHNLKNLNVSFPLTKFIAITGVSGSGKSSLIDDTLFPGLRKMLGLISDHDVNYDHLDGYDGITKVLMIDQSPIGRTPRSNPATYTKSFDIIRDIFSSTRSSREQGFKSGRFSFNVKGGRCEACQGGGEVKISMQFLPDIYITCDVCGGKRYNQETLSVTYQNHNIAQVLDLTIDQALIFFKNHARLVKHLATLQAVGLGYLKLGQSAPTLSGGEAQRVKLAKELSLSLSGHTVYLLDEPTTGLHFEDVKNLMVVLKQLVKNNNTVIVIEHNLDVIKNADWIIDLGPGGGEKGGSLVAQGTPAEIAGKPQSYTGKYLQKYFT